MFEKGISISDHFDELMQLAKTSPEEFEALRRELIGNVIGDLPQHRQELAKRYQWRIDQETSRHDNSMGRCVKLSSMMSTRMLEMGRQLDLLYATKPEKFTERFSELENAVVRLDKTADF